jgi:hypothetical protein
MDDSNKYWFPAKRLGWGWGPPRMWQGWAALLLWVAAFITGTVFFAPHHVGSLGFVGYVLLMTAVLFLICYIKGEPPRWRNGE